MSGFRFLKIVRLRFVGFEEIHKCLHELRNDLEDCGGPADWNENSDNNAVCK